MNYTPLLFLIVFALFFSTVHAAIPTLEAYEGEPYAYVAHANGKVTIVNLNTQTLSTITSTNTGLYDLHVDRGGTRAYLFFNGTFGIQTEIWDLRTLTKISVNQPVKPNQTNYSIFLTNKDQTILITGFHSASNSWLLNEYEAKTHKDKGFLILPGTGTTLKQSVSGDGTKLYSAIGNTSSKVSEYNIKTHTIKSISSVLGLLSDGTTTDKGMATGHTVAGGSQMQFVDFTPITPTIVAGTIAVAQPPSIRSSADGKTILYLPSNQDLKGGFRVNNQIVCSFNTTGIKYEPDVQFAENGKVYTLIDVNGPTVTSFVREINSTNCTSTNLFPIANVPYGFGKKRMSISSDGKFMTAVEGTSLHIFSLQAPFTENVLNLPSNALSVQTRMVKRISP